MANLPDFQTTATSVFSHCGTDFGGPIDIKTSSLRSSKIIKAYMCISVCLATKAVHIEAVSTLSSDGFLAALDRFTSIRGGVMNIYSDNGPNYIGANKELQAILRDPHFLQTCASKGLTWHFIPPSSPNMGGVWESEIKCAKRLLQRSIGKLTLTFEEFSTILHKISFILNSRPLSPLSDDPEEFEALTPGHFIYGTNAVPLPESEAGEKINFNKRWRLVEQITQNLWKRWSTSYVNTLHLRQCWNKSQPNVQIGDLVIVKEDFTPAYHWPLGRVVEVYPGNDGVVKIKMRNREGKRSISKIAKL